jgi:S1-C subfamily serine protease
MTGLRFVFLNILITIVVSILMLALGWWWFSLTYDIESARNTVTVNTSSTTQLAAAAAPVDIPEVVASALPAVASIVITAEVPLYEQYLERVNPFGSWWGGFTMPRQRQVGTEEREIGGGTGFFVSADGYLVTNRHVVDQTGVDYTVVTNDGETYPVAVVALDPVLDIAILQVETETEGAFPYLTFAETEPNLGETAIAIGNALAEFPNSVSVGVVSGLSRNIIAQSGMGFETLDGLIQTDAAINRGNSGGPLLNRTGEVMGVNVAVAGNGENIGFALPGGVVAQVLQSVLETGTIERAYLGVRYVPITETLVSRNNLPVDYGVLVVRGETAADLAVMPGSPAARAGIVENDIILKIDDVELTTDTSLATVLRRYVPGDTVTITRWQPDGEEELRVTLEAMPERN